MRKVYDEPMFIDLKIGIKKKEEAKKSLAEDIRRLCDSQSFAVLATQGNGQPYATLISFAATQNLKYIIFTTPKATRKYSLIEGDKRVSLLIDNRSNQPDSINQISALTITGNARILTDEDQEHWTDLFMEKHPYLSNFVESDSTAMILVEVVRYFYVRKFQEVFEWSPKQNSSSL